jgi:hypothetical protein
MDARTPHLKMSYRREESTPPNLFSDHSWYRANYKALLEQYGECSVVIYKEQVIGRGMTYQESLEDAERNLPPDSAVITPIQAWLVHRNPLLRIQPRPTPQTVLEEA